jgi:hypothetical protein
LSSRLGCDFFAYAMDAEALMPGYDHPSTP